MPLIFGIVVLVLLPWAANAFSKADSRQAARIVRTAGGVAAVLFALFLLLRDAIGAAVLIGSVGLSLLGWTALWPAAQFNRRQAGRGENAQGDAGAGGSRGAPPRGGKMTEQEAYQILGVEPGASASEISRAHRALIKKLHPDQGGTTYLAARVNEAKDVLLRRHR